MFGKEVYVARRKALLERLQGERGIALFLGNVDAPAQYKDNCYKWRQDSNWIYFFGIDEPRFAATIDLETGEVVLILFLSNLLKGLTISKIIVIFATQ